jgi:hypothetical protein
MSAETSFAQHYFLPLVEGHLVLLSWYDAKYTVSTAKKRSYLDEMWSSTSHIPHAVPT